MALDAAIVEQALEEATQRPENLDFFLDHLTSPEWIGPLRERRLFSQPPEQFVDEERLVRAPGWAQSRYLARVAGIAPEEVLEVIQGIKTNNERVVEDFVDAALTMPVDLARKLVPVLTDFVKRQEHLYYLVPRKLVELIVRFAAEGDSEAGVALTQALLAAEAPLERDDYWRPSPRARFSDWEYDMHLRTIVSEALPRAPEAFMPGLVELLEQALEMIRSEPADPDSDASRVWRVRIGDDSERGIHVEQALVSALRDGAMAVRESASLTDAELVTILTEFEGELYRRLAMYALGRGPEPDLTVARLLVLDAGELTEAEPSPEFRDLLRRIAASLEPQEIETMLAAIDSGPDVAGYRERAQTYVGSTPSDEDVARYVARWKTGRLELLADVLPDEARSEYQRLVAEFGPAELPLSWEVSTFSGPNSPLSSEELGSKSDQELVTFLREWQPSSDPWPPEPSIEGLARVFSALTEAEPARVSRLSPRLRELKPAYLQWMAHGFEQAIRAERQFEWHPLLALLEWIVEQPREIEGGRGDEYTNDDPGWVWTRKAIAGLLEYGLSAPPASRIPFAERDRVWGIVVELASDPEPTPKYEDRYGGTNMDPATLALNTTRPRAIRAAISYAIWVYQEVFGTDSPSDVAFFERHAPEVASLLEEHLRPESDPSVAVRAAMAQFFSNLFALDASWARARVNQVFPDKDSPLRESAWGAYIIYTRPYTNVFELLRGVYLRSAQLAQGPGHGFRWINSNPVHSLGDHIAAFYWRRVISVEDELLATYWANAPTEARQHVIEQLGRWVRESEVTSETSELLQQFWAFAKAHASVEESRTELSGFEWWFSAPALPVDWRLDELQALLEEAIELRRGVFIGEQLPSLASVSPLKTLRVLRGLLESDDPWFVGSWSDQIERVLRIGYSSQDEATRKFAYDTVNLLLRKGYRNFAAVVNDPAPPG